MDLNLVRVFVEIFESRSLTSAASRLFVTQSAVSQSLARLRAALDDPLFERHGRLMQPTPVAKDVYPAFRDAMAAINGAVDKLATFNPEHSSRQFRIALSELGEVGWLANIVADLRCEAPHVRLRTFSLQVHEVEDWLSRGLVDLAIAPAELPGDLERTPIKTQTYAVVMSRDHALAGRQLTIDEYLKTPRAVVASDSNAAHLEAVERRAQAYTEPAVVAQHYATILSLVLQAPDLIAVAPRSLADGWTQAWPVAVTRLPFEMDPVRLAVYRRPDTVHSSSLDWLHRTVLRATVGLPTHFETMGAEERLERHPGR
jgi:DNA-binding transcriptional LysR family regulator